MQNTSSTPDLEYNLLSEARPSARRYFILDTNIMNYLITGAHGEVIKRLNESLAEAGLIKSQETAFCMTPFQLLEVLGTQFADASTVPRYLSGDKASDLVLRVVEETLEEYLQLPEFSQTSLEKRARERRQYLPQECLELFDICVLGPVTQTNVGKNIASTLAWDAALKATYPKSISADIDLFFASLLLTKGHSHISRFRIVKRMWDKFYPHALKANPTAVAEINKTNKAMRLKSRRDFLDCDLIHLACFGWFGEDVLVITCDPPESILGRLSVYKGMIAAIPSEVAVENLPEIRRGIIASCDPAGTITHVFPVQSVPSIV